MADEVQDAPDEYQNEFSRRDFVKGAAAFTATALANASAALAARKPEKSRSPTAAGLFTSLVFENGQKFLVVDVSGIATPSK